jgi:hypothetical protein
MMKFQESKKNEEIFIHSTKYFFWRMVLYCISITIFIFDTDLAQIYSVVTMYLLECTL